MTPLEKAKKYATEEKAGDYVWINQIKYDAFIEGYNEAMKDFKEQYKYLIT